jgi:hypothetical protein
MALLSRLRPALNSGVRRPLVRYPTLTRRSLHLAPPYLLDDYVPQYHLLSSVDASKKRSLAYAHLRECNLCPRLCGVNRYEKTGVCLIGAETVKVNTIAPHFGEGMTSCTIILSGRVSGADTLQSRVSRDTMVAAACSFLGAIFGAYQSRQYCDQRASWSVRSAYAYSFDVAVCSARTTTLPTSGMASTSHRKRWQSGT